VAKCWRDSSNNQLCPRLWSFLATRQLLSHPLARAFVLMGNLIFTYTEKEIVGASKPSKNEAPRIYFLIRNEKIVYVGQSIAFGARMQQHLNGKKIFDSIAHIDVYEEDLGDVEAFYIVKFNPEYNKTLPPNNLYLGESKISKRLKIPISQVKATLAEIGIFPQWQNCYLKKDVEEKTIDLSGAE
jgi:hypothetical protein